jgi:hypothetical protein
MNLVVDPERQLYDLRSSCASFYARSLEREFLFSLKDGSFVSYHLSDNSFENLVSYFMNLLIRLSNQLMLPPL